MDLIKPGTIVTCREHLDRGEATATYVNHDRAMAFLVWGKFGVMSDREYALVPLETLSRQKRERKRIPIKKKSDVKEEAQS